MGKAPVGKLQVPGQPREGGRGTEPPACMYVPCIPALLESTFLAFWRISVISQQGNHEMPDLKIEGLLIAHVVPLWESDKKAGDYC